MNKISPSSLLLNSSNFPVAQLCKCNILISNTSIWLFKLVPFFSLSSLFISECWYSMVCMSRFKLKYFFEHRLSSFTFSLSCLLSLGPVSVLLSKISRLFFSFFNCIQLLYLSCLSLLHGFIHIQHTWCSGTLSLLMLMLRQLPCCQHKQISHLFKIKLKKQMFTVSNPKKDSYIPKRSNSFRKSLRHQPCLTFLKQKWPPSLGKTGSILLAECSL